ncbi:MAG: hypothetical protein ACE5EJ_00845 [Nitrosopumilaceae archaeon]
MNVEKLVGIKNNYKTMEKKVKKYLRTLPDEEIKNLYEGIEFTPFPVFLRKEYQKRFSIRS